jgi:hypothetical protein
MQSQLLREEDRNVRAMISRELLPAEILET